MTFRTVYSMLPHRSNWLDVDEESLHRLYRRLKAGRGDVGLVRAGWLERDGAPTYGDAPSGDYGAPVLSRRVCQEFADELAKGGSLLPVTFLTPGADDYSLYVVDRLVDCIDVDRSSEPDDLTGEMDEVFFRPEALDTSAPAFRVPQSYPFVFWNGYFVERLREFGVVGVQFLAVWSEDPNVKVFAMPMQ